MPYFGYSTMERAVKSGEVVTAKTRARLISAIPPCEGGTRTFLEDGYTLKVYDCYRPMQAVAAFVDWSKEPDNPGAKRTHYPNLSKSSLFPDYIATRSGHSRGATLDVTIVPAGSSPAEANPVKQEPCTVGDDDDNGLDMGTGFDCFDPKANTVTNGLTAEQKRNRQLLVEVMSRHGFKNYPKEIWHYTFEPEPFPDTYFNFPVLPRPVDGTSTPSKT